MFVVSTGAFSETSVVSLHCQRQKNISVSGISDIYSNVALSYEGSVLWSFVHLST